MRWGVRVQLYSDRAIRHSDRHRPQGSGVRAQGGHFTLDLMLVEIKVNALTLGIPTTPEYNTKDGFRPILRTEGVRWVYTKLNLKRRITEPPGVP